MEWVVIYVVLCVFVAMGASSRNRSAILWLLLSLLTTPLLAILLLAFVGANPSTASTAGKACPKCGAHCPETAVMCGKCDFDFSAPPVADIRACPHCAEEIKIAAKVCKHCGRDVGPEPAVMGE